MRKRTVDIWSLAYRQWKVSIVANPALLLLRWRGDVGLKVLNLYAGIGGNRKLWPSSWEVTAIEIDAEIAAVYQEYFPQDTVIVADAHEYLRLHHKEFDFIWSSPPCPTHSRIRYMSAKGGMTTEEYPDMTLYQEILFLKHYAQCPWVVENVIPFYEPLIRAKEISRHLFWSNFIISDFRAKDDINIKYTTASDTVFGFSLKGKKLKKRKDQILRNCVNPTVGLHVLECAFRKRQEVLVA